MTEYSSVNQNMSHGKLMRKLQKRSTVGMYSRGTPKRQWPAALPFSLLNKIDTRPALISRKQKLHSQKKTCPTESQQTASTTPMLNTISVMSFSRPQTSYSQPRFHRTSSKRKSQQQNQSLFDIVKQEKIMQLEEQKERLMATMFEENKTEIHRIDEPEDISNKPNALNFKAYRFLNRLMDIKEQIYLTTNHRPKTSQQLRKRKGKAFI